MTPSLRVIERVPPDRHKDQTYRGRASAVGTLRASVRLAGSGRGTAIVLASFATLVAVVTSIAVARDAPMTAAFGGPWALLTAVMVPAAGWSIVRALQRVEIVIEGDALRARRVGPFARDLDTLRISDVDRVEARRLRALDGDPPIDALVARLRDGTDRVLASPLDSRDAEALAAHAEEAIGR